MNKRLLLGLSLVVIGCGRNERFSQRMPEDPVIFAGESNVNGSAAFPEDTTPEICPGALEVSDCATNAGYKVSQWRGPGGGTEVVSLGVYAARSNDRSGASHPEGAAQVIDSRRNPHVLMLSSYEPTVWTVSVSPGTGLQRIVVAGYHAQRVIVPPGIRVDNFGANQSQGFACTIAIPADGQGCDPATMHRFASRLGLGPISAFAGCYLANTFKVSDCTESSEWKTSTAVFNRETSACAGARYVKYNPAMQLWLGAELCSATEYKLYLSRQETGPFDPITDSAGHGQDHCEVLVPDFALPNDDDVTSGGCSNCSVTAWNLWTVGGGNEWNRSRAGEAFQFGPWSQASHHTSSKYSCGVSIP